jgi:uncharacterized protein (DUF697 family)
MAVMTLHLLGYHSVQGFPPSFAGWQAAGEAIVASLLKMIPGAGSVIGGTIAAATAAALTTAFGEAYIAALDMLFVNNNGEPPTSEEVAEAFKKKYSQLAIIK